MSGLTSDEFKALYKIMETELAPFKGVVASFVTNQKLRHRDVLSSFVTLMPTDVEEAFQQLIKVYAPEEQKQEPSPSAAKPEPPPGAKPEPPPAALKPEEDPRYAPYFQQKKMGVPLDGIKLKMTMAGLDPSFIETPEEAAARVKQEAEVKATKEARAKSKAEAEAKAKAEAEAKAKEEEEAKRTVEVITQELKDLATQKQKKIDEAYNNILKPWADDIIQIKTIILSVGDLQSKANKVNEQILEDQAQLNFKSRRLQLDKKNQILITEIKQLEAKILSLQSSVLHTFEDNDWDKIRGIVNTRGLANFDESLKTITLTNYEQLHQFLQQLDKNPNIVNAKNNYQTRQAEIEAQDNPGIEKLEAELQAKKDKQAAVPKTPVAQKKGTIPRADPAAQAAQQAARLAEEAEEKGSDSDDGWGGGWLPREQYITLFW